MHEKRHCDTDARRHNCESGCLENPQLRFQIAKSDIYQPRGLEYVVEISEITAFHKVGGEFYHYILLDILKLRTWSIQTNGLF
jgi:hypothetical protein